MSNYVHVCMYMYVCTCIKCSNYINTFIFFSLVYNYVHVCMYMYVCMYVCTCVECINTFIFISSSILEFKRKVLMTSFTLLIIRDIC